MKKKTAFAAVLVVTILILSVFMMNNTAASEKTQERQPEQMMYNDCAGTWYLSYENDLTVLNEAFPDLYAFGNELTIRPDGKIYWHIGAAGAAGTYESYGNQMTACVSDIMEYDEYKVALTVDDDGNLLMKYRSVPLVWTYDSADYR